MSKHRKVDNSKNISEFFNTKPKRFGLIVVIVILMGLLFDLSPFGGNIAYYVKWATCGRSPLMSATAPGAGMSWYEETKPLSIGRGYPTYYCTETEAHVDGLADPCIVPGTELTTGCYK